MKYSGVWYIVPSCGENTALYAELQDDVKIAVSAVARCKSSVFRFPFVLRMYICVPLCVSIFFDSITSLFLLRKRR